VRDGWAGGRSATTSGELRSTGRRRRVPDQRMDTGQSIVRAVAATATVAGQRSAEE